MEGLHGNICPEFNIITIRLLFSLAAVHDLELDQTDYVIAFLYEDLEEYLYMEVTEGLRDHQNHDQVSKL